MSIFAYVLCVGMHFLCVGTLILFFIYKFMYIFHVNLSFRLYIYVFIFVCVCMYMYISPHTNPYVYACIYTQSGIKIKENGTVTIRLRW